jgi:uncharacterized protein (TIGR03067 family)
MKALLTVATGLAFLVTAAAQDNDAAVKKEKARLKGTWKFLSLETEDGKKDDFESATLTFDGDKMEFKKGDETKTGTYSINPAGKPKEIDLKADDKEMQGIYKFDKENLLICICPGPDQARPNEFAAKNPYVLATLKRLKE